MCNMEAGDGVIVTSGLAISLPFPGPSLERSLGGGVYSYTQVLPD